MTQPNVPGRPGSVAPTNLQLQGGAAIIAPVSAFPGGVPGNALIVLPLSQPSDELKDAMSKGPVVIELEQMWKLLGFNGPAVQVQDQEGRPIAIGLEDLLGGLEKHWQEDKNDLNRGRLYAQELMKYGRFEKAEKVHGQGRRPGRHRRGLARSRHRSAPAREVGHRRGHAEGRPEPAAGQSLPLPAPGQGLQGQERRQERTRDDRARDPHRRQLRGRLGLSLSAGQRERGRKSRAQAVDELADAEPNKRSAAPYIAIQGFYAAEEDTRDKAIEFAKKAVERNDDDPLALICLSALYGQKGDLPSVIGLLSKHETKMASDVRLANNYFEALFQARQLDKVTKLLNALAGSPNREVKQFAIERSRMVAQYLQQQQQQLTAGAGGAGGAGGQRRA